MWDEIRNRLPVVVLTGALLCNLFLVGVVHVEGESMLPTISDGAYVLCQKAFFEAERGDIVIAVSDGSPVIKRVIGLPGETVFIDEDGCIYINGLPYRDGNGNAWRDDADYCGVNVELGEDEYFLIGDNREVSRDSRITGPVSGSHIYGKVLRVL